MNPFLLPMAAAEPSAVHYLSGMLMVIVTLTALLVLMTIASLILRKLFPTEVPAAPAAAAASASTAPATEEVKAEGIDPEIIAAIAAAVATTLDGPHRVVSIKQKPGSWEKAGRQSILSSHRIR